MASTPETTTPPESTTPPPETATPPKNTTPPGTPGSPNSDPSLTKSPTQADKLRTQQELERLQAKYVGTGHPDTTSWEWRVNIARDTYASIIGHRGLLTYIALAENEPIQKVRVAMIRKMIQPCGPPPPREGD